MLHARGSRWHFFILLIILHSHTLFCKALQHFVSWANWLLSRLGCMYWYIKTASYCKRECGIKSFYNQPIRLQRSV